MALNTLSLFPTFAVRWLRNKQGERWSDLVDYVRTLDSIDPQAMAFSLTVRQLKADNKVAQSLCDDPRCAVCASQVIDSFEGDEDELLARYHRNLDEIKLAIGSMRIRQDIVIKEDAA
jgi:hypothetical protein